MKRLVLTISIVIISLLSLVCYRFDLYNEISSKKSTLISLLQPQVLLPQKIYIFTNTGLPIQTGNIGGRVGADLNCNNLYSTTFSSFLNVSVVRAFISVSNIDQIKDLVPTSIMTDPVYGVKSNATITPIANAWTDLWSTATIPLLNSVGTATDAGAGWWSGSDTLGQFDTVNNCTNWSSSIVGNGTYGDPTVTGATWIQFGTLPCSSALKLLCVAY
jgi:hypothetical protein